MVSLYDRCAFEVPLSEAREIKIQASHRDTEITEIEQADVLGGETQLDA